MCIRIRTNFLCACMVLSMVSNNCVQSFAKKTTEMLLVIGIVIRKANFGELDKEMNLYTHMM